MRALRNLGAMILLVALALMGGAGALASRPTPGGADALGIHAQGELGDPGFFIESGQLFGFEHSQAVALGDLDGDGDLDAFAANMGPDRVWLNDGWGRFEATTQSLGDDMSAAVALGDLDGDDDLDAVVGNLYGQPNRIWLNDGAAHFTDPGHRLPSSSGTEDLAIGHLDGDGPGSLPDIYCADLNADEVWLQVGILGPVDSGQRLGTRYSEGVALGDVDDDGDLDAVVANRGHSQVWFNDGAGLFTDGGQDLGDGYAADVALADFDGDDDLDAFIAYDRGEPDRLFLNDGTGAFTDSGLRLGAESGRAVGLGDLDGDGYTDAFVANEGASMVWFWDDGWGGLVDGGQRLGNWASRDVALGDLDGDDDLDAFAVNGEGSNIVWLNSGGARGDKPLFLRNYFPFMRRG